MKQTPFLKQIARHFFDRHRDELYRYRFYFQNRRAGIFFLHYLKESASERGETIFLPTVTTLTDELYLRAGVERPDPNNEIFIVYEMYKVISEEISRGGEEAEKWQRLRAEKFSDFYQFGSLILNDFNDIDKQLADAGKIYQNAHEQLEIDLQFRRKLSDAEKKAIVQLLGDSSSFSNEYGEGEMGYVRAFVSIFSLLTELYEKTKLRLRKRGLFYPGMLIRDAVEEGSRLLFEPDPEATHVIVGLNALSESEKRLLKVYKEKAETLFYWDYEGFVFRAAKDLMDLGRVMKENLKAFPMPEGEDYIPFEKVNALPDVEVTAIPSKVAQTVFVSHNRLVPLLTPTSKSYDPGFAQKVQALEVAVVLPNERLLMPLLSNLPGEVSEINVTMGYPLKETPVAGMLLRILTLFRIVTSRGKSGAARSYYLADELMEILSMKALEPLIGDTVILKTIGSYLDNKQIFRVDDEHLEALFDHLDGWAGDNAAKKRAVGFLRRVAVFPPVESMDEPQGAWLLGYVTDVVSALEAETGRGRASERKILGEDEREEMVSAEDTVYVFILDLLDRRLSSLFAEEAGALQIDLKMMSDLLKGLLSNARIPYEGEPLKGLQVLGILETRSLDFDTIFIPDASEGVLPAHTRLNSLIPHSIRQGNGLPTYKWQELTRAYNFFRLISRASKVYASFDSRKNESSDGEPSRYLRLLEYVFGPMFKEGLVRNGTASYVVRSSEENRHELATDPEKIAFYRQCVTSDLPDPKLDPDSASIPAFSGIKYRSISASALNDFLGCPKLFYYKHVEGRRDTDRSTGLLEEKDKGNLLHETLRRLYKPFIGEPLDGGVLSKWLDPGNRTIRSEMDKIFGTLYGNMSSEGYNANELDVVEEQIRRVVLFDVNNSDKWIYVGGEVHFSGKMRTPALSSRKDAFGGEAGERPTGETLSVNISGSIDRIMLSPDLRKLVLVDFKTGGDHNTTSVASVFTGNFEHVVTQLSFYSLATGEYLLMRKGEGSGLFESLVLDTKVSLLKVEKIVPMMFKPLDGSPVPIFYGASNEVIDFMHQDISPKNKSRMNLREWFSDKVMLESVAGMLDEGQAFGARKNNGCTFCFVRALCPIGANA